ncbi:MAG: hypothetical protein MRY21_01020 [Simkaniaceae bacterium]|nr:hypothetical protein [Simkaniaceae bacterium]
MTLAEKIREKSIEMCFNAKAAHCGSSLSLCEILAALYGCVKRPGDHVLVSKGHAAAAVYAALAYTGHFPLELLDTYMNDGSILQGHISHKVPGVELSTGSLGHALPVGCGLAMGDPKHETYVVLSDGELEEGSNWEALLYAPKHINNLSVIIDYNKIQSFSMANLEPLADKLTAFGWKVREVDGHDVNAIERALETPCALIAHTIKGKGLGELENTLESHYRTPAHAHSIHSCPS